MEPKIFFSGSPGCEAQGLPNRSNTSDASTGPRQAKIVLFDLPFIIFVKDNAQDKALEDWLAAVREGLPPPYSPYVPCPNKPSSLTIGGGIPVFIPSSDVAPPYFVRTTSLEARLRFIRRVNPHRAMVLMGEVPGDRTGRASFSTVECYFDIDALGNRAAGMPIWAEAALDVVNHFIQHYRVIADRSYIYPVTPSIVQHFDIGTVTEGADTTWQQYATGSGALNGLGGSIPEEQDSQLRAAIANSSPPDVKLILDQQVKSYLDLREWRLAIIETAVLFEAYLTNVLVTYLSQKGLPSGEIRALLHKEDGRPHEVEHLAKSVIRKLTGFDFAQTVEFQRWKEDVLRIRNEVVHGRTFDISKADAERAFRVSLDAARVINRSVFGVP